MINDKSILICKDLKFYSKKDENVFFEWINKIDCIDSTSVHLNEFHLYMASDELEDDALRNLLALFYRYKLDMSQLKRFLTKDNKKWFFDKKYPGYWNKKVFG